MDGSLGFHGHVVAAWQDWRSRNPIEGPSLRLYGCGPLVMLQAIAQVAAEQDLRCQISVETVMGCGVGICMGCVIENADARDPELYRDMSPYDRWLLVCRQGPVFDSSAIVLEGGSLH
jgi:dihydroorotate dehydrogenase electron transfer subunit